MPPRRASTAGKQRASVTGASSSKGDRRKSLDAGADDALKKLGRANDAVFSGESLNTSMLEYHNQLRAEHRSPPLQFSDQLAKWAKLSAADSADQDRLITHNVPAGCSANFWEYRPHEFALTERYATYFVAHAIQAWYGEIENWDFETCQEKKKPKSKSTCKHFTQLVWQETTHVACSVAKSDSHKWYVACVYSPAGNTRRTYRRNVPPIGGHPESLHSKEEEDAAVFIQSLARGRKVRGGGLVELRAEFHVGGDIDIYDAELCEWIPAKIVEMGGGHTIAEYSTPTQSGIRKEVRLGDTNLRAKQKNRTDKKGRRESMHSPDELKAQFESAAERKKRLEFINSEGIHHAKQFAGVNESTLMGGLEEERANSALGLMDGCAPGGPPAALVERRRHERVAECFRKWDTDGNGSISKDEMVTIFAALGWPPEQTELLFFDMDKDQDGEIDYEEFLMWLGMDK